MTWQLRCRWWHYSFASLVPPAALAIGKEHTDAQAGQQVTEWQSPLSTHENAMPVARRGNGSMAMAVALPLAPLSLRLTGATSST